MRFNLSVFAIFMSYTFCVFGQIPQLPDELLKEIAPKESVAIQDDQYFQQLIRGVNQFAFDIYHQLRTKQGNIIVSPYSIASGMSMVGIGAKGETAVEIQRALHYSLNLSPLIHDLNQFLGANATLSKFSTLNIAESIWLKQGIAVLPSFEIALKRSFNFVLQSTDFNQQYKAIQTINQWMSHATNGKINSVLSSQDISRETNFVLTTGFYWKGNWQMPFDRRKTEKVLFNYRGHPLQVEMMNRSAEYRVLHDQRFDLVEIMFKPISEGKGQLAMIVFLPKERANLDLLDESFSAAQWDEWMKQLTSQSTDLYLPKFRVENTFDLNAVMKGLGISKAFESSADFSAISEKAKVYLNKAVHKTLLRMDEDGSDGMASYEVNANQKLEKGEVIKVDRPFFFVIQEQTTGLILCIGRIVQP